MRLVVPPQQEQALRDGWKQSDGLALLNGMDETIAANAMPAVWRAGNAGGWKPLSPKYVRRKVREGRSAKIWEYTKASTHSLMTPAKIGSGGGFAAPGRIVRVSENSKGRVAMIWRMTANAARGWFEKNNLLRPFLTEAAFTPEIMRLMEQRAMKPIYAALQRMGYKIKGTRVFKE